MSHATPENPREFQTPPTRCLLEHSAVPDDRVARDAASVSLLPGLGDELGLGREPESGSGREPESGSGRDQLALLGDLGRVLSLVSFLGVRSLSAGRDRPEQPSSEHCAGEA